MGRSIQFAFALLLAAPIARSAAAPEQAGKEAQVQRPEVKVLSPASAVFLMGQERSLVVVVEVTDATGAGILTTDSGVPRFVDPSKNVDLFEDRLIAHGTYTDGRGRSVIQLVSEIPTAKLQTGEFKLTPPIDPKRIPAEFKKQGFTVSPQAMLDAAHFEFQVKDRAGVMSEVAKLYVAVASDFFGGPYLPPPPEPLEKEAPKPDSLQGPPKESDGGE